MNKMMPCLASAWIEYGSAGGSVELPLHFGCVSWSSVCRTFGRSNAMEQIPTKKNKCASPSCSFALCLSCRFFMSNGLEAAGSFSHTASQAAKRKQAFIISFQSEREKKPPQQKPAKKLQSSRSTPHLSLFLVSLSFSPR